MLLFPTALWIQLRIVHDEGYVDHFFIHRVGLFTHAVRQAALAVVGNPQDDRVVGQSAILQRVKDSGDVLVHNGVEIRVEVDVVCLRLRAIQWRELVVGIAGHFLDLRFGRQIIGVVRRELDAEVGEVVTPVTGLLPRWRLHVATWVDADIVRVHQ
jgi:hypothetical protein